MTKAPAFQSSSVKLYSSRSFAWKHLAIAVPAGLAVVRSLVEAHGGAITIGDAPTGGARFTISLALFHA